MDFGALTNTVPGAIGTFFGVVGALITGVRTVAKIIRAKDDKAMQAVPPTQTSPQPANTFGPVPQTDPALLALFSLTQATAMQQARLTLDELRKALDQAGQDQARLAQREAAANQLKDRLVFELECERSKVASLGAAKAEREQRIAQLEAERDALEARIPTPMRPPARRP